MFDSFTEREGIIKSIDSTGVNYADVLHGEGTYNCNRWYNIIL